MAGYEIGAAVLHRPIFFADLIVALIIRLKNRTK